MIYYKNCFKSLLDILKSLVVCSILNNRKIVLKNIKFSLKIHLKTYTLAL